MRHVFPPVLYFAGSVKKIQIATADFTLGKINTFQSFKKKNHSRKIASKQ